MLTIEQVRNHLKNEKMTKVAQSTGLHYNTVRDVLNGKVDNPSVETLVALNKYIDAKA